MPRPIFVTITFIVWVCGVGAACSGNDDPGTSGSKAQKHPQDIVRLAETLASEVSSQAHDLLVLVISSEWGARYGMLSPADDNTRKSEYRAIKTAESLARDALAAQLWQEPGIDMTFLVYGDFVLFVERHFENDEERRSWIENSGGDMYKGPFSQLEFGMPCESIDQSGIPEVVENVNHVAVGVPVCFEGSYVCGLYLRMKKPTE